MSGSHPRASGLAIAAACVLGGAAEARAQTAPPQDDGPIIVGEKIGKYKWWDLQWSRLELEYYGEFRTDKQSTQGQPDQVVRENRNRGTANFSFESYIGHKNLLDLTGNFKLGLEDQTITSSIPGSDVHETPFTNLYDIQGLLFGNSSTPLTLYSRREETITGREFLGSLRTETSEHGAILSIDNEKFPTRLHYFHRDQTQTDPVGSLDYTALQDTFNLQTQTRLTDDQRLEFTYTYDHIDEDSGTLLSDQYDRHDGTLTHTWYFGSEKQSNLRSNLRLYDRDGRFSQSIARLDEQAVFYHSDRLETRYNLALEEQTRGDAEQRLISGNAQIRHKLFDSLVSTATAGGSNFEIPGEFDSTDLFASGTLDYTKIVPYGRLNASAGLGVNHQENSARGTDIFVLNESRTFTDPLDLVISRRNVIPSSIRITDTTQLVTYTENVDYTVDASIGEVRLRRIATGGIINGQSVLISYQIGPEPGSEIDTLTQTYSLRYTFNEGWLSGLALYTVLQVTDHEVSAADPSLFVLDDVTDWKYGAEYRIGDFWFLAEMQNHDSSLSPYDRLRLEAHFDRRVGRTTTLSAEYVHEEIDYESPSNSVIFDRVQGRWIEHLRAGFDLNLYLQYREEHNERDGDIRAFEQAIELNWRYRQTRMYVGFRNAMLEGDTSDRTSQTLTLGLVRTF